MLNGLSPQEFEQRFQFVSFELDEAEYLGDIKEESVLYRIPEFEKTIRFFQSSECCLPYSRICRFNLVIIHNYIWAREFRKIRPQKPTYNSKKT